MSAREVRAVGLEALMLATELLQRARRADSQAGLWEAADVQWWWRTPRRSDEVEKLFWVDDEGPVAGVLLTSWTDDAWQCDPVLVPGASGLEPGDVWRRAIEHAAKHSANGFDVPVGDDDRIFRELAQRSGFTAGHHDGTAGAAPRGVSALRPGARPRGRDHRSPDRRTLGIDRLVTRGAQRVKVSYETDAAAALYQGVGFLPTSTTTWYRALSE